MPSCMLTDYPALKTLKISKNKLGGPILGGKNHLSIKWDLYLDGNEFEGTLPRYLTADFDAYGTMDLHDNKLSGKLDFSLWNLSSLCTLSLAGNSLTGEIHPSICNFTRIMFLDLSYNNLSGPMPNCSTALELEFMSVSQNFLSGHILPNSFFNSSTVMGLDLSHNQFTGNIEWVQYLGEIMYLSLGSNRFEGQISPGFCQLQSLRILDLSNNSLSGPLPPCIGNISFEHSPFGIFYWSLICEHRFRYPVFNYVGCYEQRGFSFRTKGNIYVYKRNFINWMSGIDLSANMLSGEIPWELGNLRHIKALNLSYNVFAGSIPVTFANMSSVESLDLSHNRLSGAIPWQLTRLSSLSVFSVVYNNLSGCIPDSGQFTSFDMDSYKGNSLLHAASERGECIPSSGPVGFACRESCPLDAVSTPFDLDRMEREGLFADVSWKEKRLHVHLVTPCNSDRRAPERLIDLLARGVEAPLPRRRPDPRPRVVPERRALLLGGRIRGSIPRGFISSVPILESRDQGEEGRGFCSCFLGHMDIPQHQGVGNSKVVNVEKEEAWDLFINQASNEGRPVVAHFGASWCVTSLSMNYKFEELAQTHPEILFLYVDVDDVLSVSAKLGVKAMPTFFLIKGKEVVKKIVGANPDEVKKMADASAESFGTTPTDIVVE
ncbi:hypothetical protein GUJ93_ZPchr0458g22593 [Zizania palustris]|uniref:Thioredoxin domain-containing protein n=1 Tax=Zizania palustris TaxID=103762 RepID=A0A8J5R1Y1_ZIZPA|nr:hypothetical protein GUJ93_ZPchr0458g22593 [Zizania palustris]